MANFKVGDRVRIRKDIPNFLTIYSFLIDAVRGAEVVLVRRAPEQATPKYRNYWEVTGAGNGNFFADESVLEPLVPPAEDTWAADKVKQVTKPQPQAVPVRERFLSKIESVVGPLGIDP